MTPLQKRITLFLFGCIPVRLLFVYIAYAITDRAAQKAMALVGASIAMGFTIIFLGGFRKTGIETGGAPIWWNWLRPVHAILYGMFAYFAWTGKMSVAWKLLLADVCVGLISFLLHHF